MHFLMKQNDDVPCRFDVVAIAGAEGQEEITLYKDAFTDVVNVAFEFEDM